ncbi:MAG TPA: peptidoglycan recognition family protein [Desulfosporosinus sp.]|nr:peptidoglycan recognition family protein [Desulfosporosinus sp.]
MDWQKIVIHHTASPTQVRCAGTVVPVDVAMIRNWHKTKGWSDIGYHFIITPDGRCEEGRPLNRPGAHCKVSNRNSIGIGVCLVGNFSETEVPHAQLVGLVNKVVKLMGAFVLGIDDVELHKDIPGAATECPGRYFPKKSFMKGLAESLS